MSFPWYFFTVVCTDGHEIEWMATGATAAEAMGVGLNDDQLLNEISQHGDVQAVVYTTDTLREADALIGAGDMSVLP